MTDVSDICLPTPGVACGGASFHFPTRATFTFQIHNPSFFTCSSNAIYTTAASHQYGEQLPEGHQGVPRREPEPGSVMYDEPGRRPVRLQPHLQLGHKGLDRGRQVTSENGGWDFG